MAQGKADAAAEALRQAISAEDQSHLGARSSLSAQVEVALAVSDLDTASEATDRRSTSRRRGRRARARRHGRCRPRHPAPRPRRRAGGRRRPPARLRHLAGLKLPYEAARSRAAYGLALRAVGREDDAAFELEAARAAFERLGAAPTPHRSRPRSADRTSPAGLTAREVEVLRLVAAGRSNRQIAEELVISEHTVARHLQNMFTKLDVSSRAAATAFAFEHGLA